MENLKFLGKMLYSLSKRKHTHTHTHTKTANELFKSLSKCVHTAESCTYEIIFKLAENTSFLKYSLFPNSL